MLLHASKSQELTLPSGHVLTLDLSTLPTQELGVPLVIVGRHAVYSAAVPASLYDELAQTNSPIAKELQSAQRHAIDELWQRVQAPQGSSERGDMPNRCTAQWFSQVLAGPKPSPDREHPILRVKVNAPCIYSMRLLVAPATFDCAHSTATAFTSS